MRVSDLPVSEELRLLLESHGIAELFPPQEEAVRAGLLEGKRLLVTTPTASGKTLLAVLAADRWLSQRRKVVYLTPFRALTWEKKESFESLLGARTAAASGDYDEDVTYLGSYDVIVATYEKMDSALRHGAPWIDKVGLLVLDEAHLIGDATRGPTVEVLLARMLSALPADAQVLLLSATITNAEQIASAFGLSVVRSSWRPTRLEEAVYDATSSELLFPDGRREKVPVLDPEPSVSLALWTHLSGGQAMVYAPARRIAESLAEQVAKAMRNRFRPTRELEDLASQLHGTELDEALRSLMLRGAAFHHAGLSAQQRRVVEEAFRERLLPVIVATPTLSAGVNLPARTVIVPDARRGQLEMSVMDYKQLVGRAGRPGYDEFGLGVLVARGPRRARELMRRYVLAEPEPIGSRLADLRSLRFHVLGLVASGIRSIDSLKSFASRTLAALQLGRQAMERAVSDAVSWLEAVGMLRKAGPSLIAPTRLGRRVAELYVMPETALVLLRDMRSVLAREQDPDRWTLLALLSICSTPDVPEVTGLQLPLDEQPPRELAVRGSAYVRALALRAWIEEESENSIYLRYGAGPGDVHVLAEAATWIAQAASQLALVVGMSDQFRLFEQLARRIEHGVRPELLELVQIPGVGRVRARVLWSAGFRTAADLARARPEQLASLPMIGRETALKIREYAVQVAGSWASSTS
ncbi:MAG: DEAD/DEAH box helicase [Nitrososphaerota archaeon]